MNSSGSVLRLGALLLVVVALWFAGVCATNLPVPLGPDAPATAFSAARAHDTLARLLGPKVPHPVSSLANQAVRDRVRAAFAALGIKTSIFRATGCRGYARYGFVSCGTVEDIVAEVAPGDGKAIVLMAHYDSVPAGPGASDDLSGVATILETVRALKARGMKTQHPVLAVITDGEEAGLLGAAAFVADPQWRARIEIVLNFEARGTSGPSNLFQTSPGDAALIDLYARNVPEYSTGSLFQAVYKILPNDTDLTEVLGRGIKGVNFAFIGGFADYHTPNDRLSHLDLSTLQMHGDSALGMASALMRTDYAALESGDAIYLTLFGRVLPRLPASWAVPLSLLAIVLLGLAAFLSRDEILGIGRRLAAFAIPLLALLAAALAGWLLHTVASLVSGQPNPSFAHPLWLRLSLAIAVAGVLVAVARISSARLTALSVWGWYAALSLLTAIFATGFSPYFLFPLLVAAVALLILAIRGRPWTGTAAQVLLFIAALAALAIWIPLLGPTESLQGLAWHPLFTVPAALGAMTLLPVLAAQPLSHQRIVLAGAAVAALVLAVVAGLVPAYSVQKPQALNIDFIDDHVANRSYWAIETAGSIPAALRSALSFEDAPPAFASIPLMPKRVAPAGPVRYAAPTATVSSRNTPAGRIVTLVLHGSDQTARMVLAVPKEAGLSRVAIADKSFEPSPASAALVTCVSRDCRDRTIVLTLAAKGPVTVLLAEQRFGLPADGARLARARGDTAIPIRTGDTTIVLGKIKI